MIAVITASAYPSPRDGVMDPGFEDFAFTPFRRTEIFLAWRATRVCAIRLRKRREISRTCKPPAEMWREVWARLHPGLVNRHLITNCAFPTSSFLFLESLQVDRRPFGPTGRK
jgi:hypothetical protein